MMGVERKVFWVCSVDRFVFKRVGFSLLQVDFSRP
jgi:hypothetical protein